ncbi:MAG: C40 family peptidase [Solirubrobacteraceae bacterium]
MRSIRWPRPTVGALTAATLLAWCAASPVGAWAAGPTLANWDQVQQRAVWHAGLMGNFGRWFAGASPLSEGQANSAMAALSARLASAGAGKVAAVRTSQTPVTVTTFDAMVVDQLGLRSVAAHVQAAAAAAGLTPPSYFGTEVVARFLGFRYDHPAGTDQLELYPYNPITRAEAAWTLARVMNFASTGDVPYAQQTLSSFRLPKMSAHQIGALQVAISRIGYPYVYAGTTDDTSDGLAHGGFDCSGLVWRVFRLSGLQWGSKIAGRTAAQMAGEIPRSQRLRMNQLQSGDILFFGTAHFTSAATESDITHTGIYLGDNWVIHASRQGVSVDQLSGGWLGDSFTWGRRVVS